MTIKTEMKGTGGWRWTTREDAKQTSRKVRRRYSRAQVQAAAREPIVRRGEESEPHVIGRRRG